MLVYRAKSLLVGAALVGAFLLTGPALFCFTLGSATSRSAVGLEEVFGPAGPSKCEVFGFNWFVKRSLNMSIGNVFS